MFANLRPLSAHISKTKQDTPIVTTMEHYMYRVGQIKRSQLTFLLVTIERIYNIKQQVKRCQFYLSESVTR